MDRVCVFILFNFGEGAMHVITLVHVWRPEVDTFSAFSILFLAEPGASSLVRSPSQ